MIMELIGGPRDGEIHCCETAGGEWPGEVRTCVTDERPTPPTTEQAVYKQDMSTGKRRYIFDRIETYHWPKGQR